MANSSKGSATTGGLKYSKAAAGVGQGSKDSWAPPSPGLAHLSAEAAAQRLAFVYASLVGSKVSVTLKNQSVFEGIFHAASGKDLSLCLLQAKKVAGEGHRDAQPVSQLILRMADIESCTAHKVDLTYGGAEAGFKTDTGISGHTGQSRERVLQKWSADDDDAATASPTTLSLDSRGGAKKWDQFETNERLFGVDTDFNEEDYTTKLDRSDPRFREKEARAAKLARDIEGSASGNAHIAEERGQKVASEMDEETRYSSVIRDETKYVPPGVRKLAGDQQGASAASNSNGSARGGSAPMWSQVLGGQKNGNGAAPTTKATEKTPAVAVKNDASPANGNANKQPVTTAPAAQQPATTTAKQHQEPEGKKGPAPSAQSTTAAQQERQQASHRIAAAALDREKMQRRLQQENFMRFSQEINSKIPKVGGDASQTAGQAKPMAPPGKAIPSALPASFKAQPASPPKPIVPGGTKVPVIPEPRATPPRGQPSVPATPPRAPTSAASKIASSAVGSKSSSPAKQSENFPDNVSEADSVCTTATTATSKAKFKLNVAAAEFTPSGPTSSSYNPEHQRQPYLGKRNKSGPYIKKPYQKGGYQRPQYYPPAYPDQGYPPYGYMGYPPGPGGPFMPPMPVPGGPQGMPGYMAPYPPGPGFMPPPGGAFVPGAPGPGGPYPPMMMMPGWIPPELAQQQHQQYMEGQHGQHGYEEGQQQGEYVDTPQGGDMPEYGYQQPQGDNGGNHQGPPSPHHQDDGSQQQE